MTPCCLFQGYSFVLVYFLVLCQHHKIPWDVLEFDNSTKTCQKYPHPFIYMVYLINFIVNFILTNSRDIFISFHFKSSQQV